MVDRTVESTRPRARAGVSVDVRTAIRERLLMLATPEVVERLVRWALADDDRPEVPDDPIEVDRFVRGSLHDVVADALGNDAAEALVDDLALVLCTLRPPLDGEDSHVRISTPAPTLRISILDATTIPTETTASDPWDNEPVVSSSRIRPGLKAFHVVLASRSNRRVAEVATTLGPTVEVHRVDDVFELVDVVSTLPAGRMIVVIDASSSAVKASTLAAVAGELPEGVRVVVWGVSDLEEEDLHAIVPEADAWQRLGCDATTRELAFVVRDAFENHTLAS